MKWQNIELGLAAVGLRTQEPTRSETSKRCNTCIKSFSTYNPHDIAKCQYMENAIISVFLLPEFLAKFAVGSLEVLQSLFLRLRSSNVFLLQVNKILAVVAVGV